MAVTTKDGITIKTDNKWRNLLYGYELPKKQRKQFDYIKSDEEFETRNFAKYRGNYYDVGEFQLLPTIGDSSGKHVVYPVFRGWDGYMSDTYFSGVVIKLSSDGEQYKIGRFYS
jgi:hypothetical protein